MLTQEKLKEVLFNNPDTGIFIWKIRIRNNIHVGDKAGYLDNKGYVCISIYRKAYKAHRLAFLYMTSYFPINQGDHKNGIKHDNRWLNIRDLTNTENAHNQRNPSSNNSSGFLGVSWHKRRQKWYAQVRVNRKSKSVGYFSNKEEAYEAYLKAKRELHPTCTI